MLLWVRRVFDVKSGEGLPVALTFVYIALVVARLPPRQADSKRPLPRSSTARTPWFTSMPPCRPSWRFSCRFTTRLPPDSAPGSWRSARCCFSAPTSSCSGTASGFTTSGCCRPSSTSGSTASASSRPSRRGRLTNSLFDTRQAKRLFGLIGSGASLGAIAGGLMARVLVGRSAAPSTCCWSWPSSSAAAACS